MEASAIVFFAVLAFAILFLLTLLFQSVKHLIDAKKHEAERLKKLAEEKEKATKNESNKENEQDASPPHE